MFSITLGNFPVGKFEILKSMKADKPNYFGPPPAYNHPDAPFISFPVHDLHAHTPLNFPYGQKCQY
jgi:hypothetical protein